MTNYNALFKVGQRAKLRLDDEMHNGYISEIYSDHIIFYDEEIDHTMWVQENLNLGDLYPIYNFNF